MIRWPAKAVSVFSRLFSATQDIDVFVEDENDRAFYLILFRAVAPENLVISRVFGLGGRESVIKAAKEYADDRPALFLIDGDFDWLIDDNSSVHHNIYRINAYCVENLLHNSLAVHSVLAEEAMCEIDDAIKLFDFTAWQKSMAALIPLSIRHAVLKCVNPAQSTICGSFESVVIADEFKLPRLCGEKIELEISSAEKAIFEAVGEVDGKKLISNLEIRVKSLSDQLHAISGKALLLPLLHFQVKRLSGSKVTKDVFRFRLANHSSPDDLAEIRAALNAVG